jgi:uncharacterized protein YhaN
MIEDYDDLLKLIKEKVQPSPLEQSSIRVLPNTLVTRLCLALSEANSLSESWDKQYKRIAELEADKAELLEALDHVWDAITDWGGNDWVIDLIAKHQQPTKETQQ